MAIIGKGLNSDGLAIIPSAYRIKRIVLTNHENLEADIQNITTKIVINESLYAQSLTLKLTFKDSSNFFEDYSIIGQEKIKIIFDYKRLSNSENGEDDIKLEIDFFVSEYPTFGSDPNQAYTQVVTLFALSEQAYISNQKKISKSYTDNTAELIEKILKDDLNLIGEKFKKSETYTAISSSKGIIANQRPMDVIEWFRRQTYSENTFSPFFLYQTVDGVYNLNSLDYLISDDNEVLNTYYDVRGFNREFSSEEDFRQRDRRILSVTSDLKLNKSIQSRRGAFASRNNYLDYSNKTYTKYEYNYLNDFLNKRPSLEGKTVLSENTVIGDDKLTDFTQAHCEYISINSKAFEGNNNYNNMSKISRHFLNAYKSLFNTITHDIRLHGNLKLNAGTKIELKFPKNVDPSVRDDDNHTNEFLSGKYLITSAIHEFENDEYYVNLRVKRDSFSVDL